MICDPMWASTKQDDQANDSLKRTIMVHADITQFTTAEEAPAYRSMPHNEEAEQALLGAMLVNNDVLNRIEDIVEREHFFIPVHGRIYAAVQQIVEKAQIANPITLKAYFDNDEALAEVGGASYLAQLAANAATIINAADYARQIHEHFLRRELIAIGEDMVNDAFEHSVDQATESQIEEVEKQLFDLAESGNHGSEFRSFRDVAVEALGTMEAAFRKEAGMAGTSTGLRDLDDQLGGLHRSDLVILAGRPSMGKTALATNIAFNAAYTNRRTKADDGAVVGFFSLEMSAEQLASRIISEQTNISSDRMRKGELTNDEFNRLAVGSQELYSTPIFIDDSPALSVAQLRTRARRLKRTEKLGLIVVDYLQLLRPAGKSSLEHRVQEVSQITQALKALAKELDVPVLALSQLSRAVEQREDKRPLLSDLRESGSIEQDADAVMFVYRDEYYLERKQPQREAYDREDLYQEKMLKWQSDMEAVHNMAEVIIGKQRHGPTGTVKLLFEPSFTHFDNLADTSHLPEEMG